MSFVVMDENTLRKWGGAEMNDDMLVTVPLSEVIERPLPCVRDEHGAIAEQTVKRLMAKIDEELNELKEAVYFSVPGSFPADYVKPVSARERMAEEAADTITAITTLLDALGIDAEMRDEAQRRVNEKNRSRNRL